MDIPMRRNILTAEAGSTHYAKGSYSLISLEPPILLTGSNGKLGRVLRRAWPLQLAGHARPVWQVRTSATAGDIAWDILSHPYRGPSLAGGVIVHLAGGRADLDATAPMALEVCDLAAKSGAKHVFLASSSAVYAPDPNGLLDEDTRTAPLNDYGLAKERMEIAVREWAAQSGAGAPGITLLRIGNVLGCDSLIGGVVMGRPVTLTPVPGRPGGPIRTYIGPRSFADVLAQLCRRAISGQALPPVLNIGAAPEVCMADLLTAAGIDWHYGPQTPDVLARLVLSVDQLMSLVTLPENAADPDVMVSEWRSLFGSLP
jgi:nucleoside-diphosphate-sugar epimerase